MRTVGAELARLRAPLSVAGVGITAGLALGIATDASGWPVYATVLVLGAAAATALHLRVGLSDIAVWGLVIFALGHVAGGMIPVGEGVLYGQWLVGRTVRYDNVQHAWGFGIAGRVVWEALRSQLSAATRPRLVAAVIVLLGGLALGAVNEVVEYVLTKTLPETNVGGYENTARDLVANLVGATIAAALTARSVGKRLATHPAETPQT
jgi:uncharacterized membrane protein YjdF